jgi:hypothetical protein
MQLTIDVPEIKCARCETTTPCEVKSLVRQVENPAGRNGLYAIDNQGGQWRAGIAAPDGLHYTSCRYIVVAPVVRSVLVSLGTL